ncbi:MAG: translation elongation factor Ts [Candidatus Krumholzibacteria bacterium]
MKTLIPKKKNQSHEASTEVLMEISAAMVKELRQRTGAGLMDCKAALKESSGDIDKALGFLRIKGLAKAEKKSARKTSEGMVLSYIHPGSRIGVLVEVACETDFVARTDEFQAFSRNIAMQIAATSPLSLERDGIPEEVISQEREIYLTQAREQKKPDTVIDKIVEGRLEKYYSEVTLMDQPFIKDDSKTVRDLLTELVGKLGENIKIAKFARFQIGK